MATKIKMKHPETGILKDGFYGFSYTYLFFGFWVPLFRGHYPLAITHFAIWFVGIITLTWIPVQILFAFFFNKFYTLRLIEDGYRFDDDPEHVDVAKQILGIQ